MLDSHQLNIFLVAAETLNFTQAAERLHMSQPSVSQHIRALENHFEEMLFIRQGRSLILSDAGRVLIPLAQQFVKQSTLINEAMSSLKGHIKGRISIGCNAISGRYILPEYFVQFHKIFPEVTISCQTGMCDTPLGDLRNGDLHFLFTNQTRGIESCFEYMHLMTEEIVLITPLDHPWAQKEYIEVEELTEEQYILPAQNTLIYEKVNSALASKNYSILQLDSFLTLNNLESITLSVQKGLGLGFSSKIISTTISNVATIPIKDLPITLGVSIVRDKSQLTTAARDAFWEFMVSASADMKQIENV
ncbi:MAG: LysR family transcriptional regulator [Chloroflexi bacterium]|nr:LysR family transcriptional regulator [Chloroflexota bacterium]